MLKGISLDVRPGEHVAIVGETGSGKTTLVGLLAGLYTPSSGEILFDGHPLRDLDREHLRRQVSVVFQKPYLFEGSVLENITLRKAATLDEARRAASLAAADEFILRLPRQYDSMLDPGGANLSGGQAQRLGIARALFRDVPLLVLDEATSNLDSATEAMVW